MQDRLVRKNEAERDALASGIAAPESVFAELAVIDGQSINIGSMRDAIAAPIAYARAGKGFAFFTLNLDHLVKRRDNPAFHAAYAKANLVSADGAPVAFLARRFSRGVKRTTGADLVIPLSKEAARHQIPIALFGTSDAVLGDCAARLCHLAPGLEIAAKLSPPMGFDPTSEAAEQAMERIARSGAKIVFVALGAPKQELFSAHMRELYPDIGFVCIGAALDFIAGAEVRSPVILQSVGLEWLWRLSTNPSRMARRYALCVRMLVDLVISTRQLPSSKSKA